MFVLRRGLVRRVRTALLGLETNDPKDRSCGHGIFLFLKAFIYTTVCLCVCARLCACVSVCLCGVQHVLIVIKMVLAKLIPDEPDWIRVKREQNEFKSMLS